MILINHDCLVGRASTEPLRYIRGLLNSQTRCGLVSDSLAKETEPEGKNRLKNVRICLWGNTYQACLQIPQYWSDRVYDK